MSHSRSLVVPMWREAARIAATVRAIADGDLTDELLLVDDGSDDDTVDVAESALADSGVVGKVLREPHRGKGATVRAGVAAASGTVIAFTDADMSAAPDDIERVFAAVGSGTADVAAGVRTGKAGGPPTRRLARWSLAKLVGHMGLTGHPDTQCGLKAFARPAAIQVFDSLSTAGFAFDIEVLARAEQLGYRVAAVPVTWQHRDGGSVRLWRDSPEILVDLMRISRSR